MDDRERGRGVGPRWPVLRGAVPSLVRDAAGRHGVVHRLARRPRGAAGRRADPRRRALRPRAAGSRCVASSGDRIRSSRASTWSTTWLARAVNAAGGEIALDQRVRRAGSHHQKLVLIRRPSDPRVTSRSWAASICVTGVARRRASGRPPARGSRRHTESGPGTTSRSRCEDPPWAISTTPSVSDGTIARRSRGTAAWCGRRSRASRISLHVMP